MNTAVTAKGMQVKAASSGGLAIASYDSTGTAPNSTDFATEATAFYLGSALALNPTSFNGTKWYKAQADAVDSYKASSHKELETGDDVKNYYLLSKFQIKSLDESATGSDGKALYISSISVSDSKNSTTLNKSLRVVVNIGSAYYYFAPLYTEALAQGTTLKYWSGTAETTYSSIYTNYNWSYVQVLKAGSSGLTTTPQAVDIYIYYEGEDENCASVYAINIDTLSVSVSFSTESSAQ